ncbi:MAG: alpha/beta fold hydrolase [Acidimicrobiaceae bacterium]|nr:alpha/beta fold hydrolase [Acidimicrobiaceae bacterium]
MTLPTPIQTSLRLLDMALESRFGEIQDAFAPQLRSLASADVLRAAWASEIAKQGVVKSVGVPFSESAGPGVIVVKVPLACEKGAMTLIVSMTESLDLVGLQLATITAAAPTAEWEPPNYVDEQVFDEREIMLSSGLLAVPGTISIPSSPGLKPAAVLLSGSGPNDRDETLGRNKPLKDLAWGLASHGVVTLRFDKVSYAHPKGVKSQDFTLFTEYVPDTVAAVRLLEELPEVDAKRIFLIGHSLGGTVAPRIATKEPSIAGLVILAGGAQPLHWAIIRQLRYLASLDPASAKAAQSTIDALVEQAVFIDSPDFSALTSSTDLLLGIPAQYWLDLRDYDPVAFAKELQMPILVLQGARDYQATEADDLSLWSAGLAAQSEVTFRIYPTDNHLFFRGTGPSTPAEYEPAQHMDRSVIADIAAWIFTGTLPSLP